MSGLMSESGIEDGYRITDLMWEEMGLEGRKKKG
jgi:hypothetical protein